MSEHEKVVVEGKRLGRLPTPPEMLARNLKLAKYVQAFKMPTPPALPIDVSEGITSWPMYLNNSLGDCACAAPGHMEMIFSKAATGTEKDPTDQDVLALYELQGYVPGNPATDQGSSMGNVLSDWRNGKWSASSIYAYCQVDPTNDAELQLAMWLFRGLYIGIALPLTAQSQNDVWDVVDAPPSQNGPGTWGGHAVNLVSMDADGSLEPITWARRIRMTKAFRLDYVDEAYCVITHDLKQGSTLADNGFDVEQLEADMAELGSN